MINKYSILKEYSNFNRTSNGELSAKRDHDLKPIFELNDFTVKIAGR